MDLGFNDGKGGGGGVGGGVCVCARVRVYTQKSYLTRKVEVAESKRKKKVIKISSMPPLNKKFTYKLMTRAKRERIFSSNFQTSKWIFP